MPKPSSHVTDISPRSPRVFSGEKTGKRVAGWLNWGTDELSKRVWRVMNESESLARVEQRRVEKILRLYRQVEKGFLEWPESTMRIPFKQLDRKLRRYSYYPVLIPIRLGSKLEWARTRKKVSQEKYDDSDAIFDLMELAREDLIDRLKQCRCGRWIWARFSHQKFCSAKCREKEFRSSPEWKAHRRKKAREYYKLHKSGKVK